MLSIFKEVNELVNLANRLIAESGPTAGYDEGDWVVFFKTRSFIAISMSVLFTVLAMFGVPVPFGDAIATELVYEVGAVITATWAFAERLMGEKRVIWNKEQADKAVTEAAVKAAATANGDLY